MIVAPIQKNEIERLNALRKYEILDTEPEEAFNAMVRLASYICQTPIAAISLVDETRQWFKAIVGLDAKETSREVAFCAHTILGNEAMIVEDAKDDERFSDNPLVTSAPGIRFYAGIPLTTIEGLHLGTLCVIDKVPRILNQAQLEAIKTLADNVMAHLDLLLSHKQARHYIDELLLSASIFDAASEAMVISDSSNRIMTVNPAFTIITGYTLEEVIGKNPSILSSGRHPQQFYSDLWKQLNENGKWKGELWNRRKNGENYAQQLSINVVRSGEKRECFYVAIFSDITEKKQADELIWQQANYDHLTQLPNRMQFKNRLSQELHMSNRLHQSVSLLFLDLDRFKVINDTLGHDVGDELLKLAADRIQKCVRKTDTVSRIGGDEFTVIAPQINDAIDTSKIAQKIINAMESPFLISDKELCISASIGIATFPLDSDNAEGLIHRADVAMYEAKKSGRGKFCIFQDP